MERTDDMQALLLGLASCTQPPEGIPDAPVDFAAPGATTAAWLPASPDHLQLLASLDRVSPTEPGACPAIDETADGFRVTGDGCSTEGGRWLGSLDISSTELVFHAFGAEDDRAAWTMDGWLRREPAGDEPVESLAVRGTLDWSPLAATGEADAPVTAWMDLRFSLGWEGARQIVEELEGEIGLVELGTATVSGELAGTGASLGCEWPDEGAVELEGAQRLRFGFEDGGEASCPPCPAVELDGAASGRLCDGGDPPRLFLLEALALRRAGP